MKERINLKSVKKVLSPKDMKNVLGGSGGDCYCPDNGEVIVGFSCSHPGCGTYPGYGGCGCM